MQVQPSLHLILVRTAAQICHETNRAYCRTLGDHSQPEWAEAADWQRQSAIAGVQFLLDHPDATPADCHESWLRQKTEDGWKYGPVKDPDKLEHPCMVPYDQLPPEQRTKDHLFHAVVRALFSPDCPLQ